jgi:copper chaperone CopZ
MSETINFTVTGETSIHCAGCEQRISRALRRIPGIQNVQTSIPHQQIVVTFEPTRVSSELIQTKLGEIGYEVTRSGSTQ